MREIKFRVWDIESPYMLDWEEVQMDWVREGYHDAKLRGDHYIPMQYTGLKDKDGKEIYEGDVIEYNIYGHILDIVKDVKDYKRDAVTMARFPVYWLEKEEFGYEGEDLVTPHYTEVIGNIYENPELLEGQ